MRLLRSRGAEAQEPKNFHRGDRQGNSNAGRQKAAEKQPRAPRACGPPRAPCAPDPATARRLLEKQRTALCSGWASGPVSPAEAQRTSVVSGHAPDTPHQMAVGPRRQRSAPRLAMSEPLSEARESSYEIETDFAQVARFPAATCASPARGPSNGRMMFILKGFAHSRARRS